MAEAITVAHPHLIRRPNPSRLSERPHAALRCRATGLPHICLVGDVCAVGLHPGLRLVDFHNKLNLKKR